MLQFQYTNDAAYYKVIQEDYVSQNRHSAMMNPNKTTSLGIETSKPGNKSTIKPSRSISEDTIVNEPRVTLPNF